MRLVTCGPELRPGVLVDDRVVDLTTVLGRFAATPPEERMLDLIEHFDQLRPEIEEEIVRSLGVASDVTSPAGEHAASVRVHAPIPRPGKILAAVGNFTEFGHRAPEPIDWFFKSPESVIGPDDTVVLPPHPARVFHHEAELGVVIGRPTRNIAEADAMSAVFGYVVLIDVSARDVGRPNVGTFFGKSFDTFGPMGPCLVTADEIPDPLALQVRLWVNGELRQDYPLSDIMHGIPELVAHASSFVTLLPGDVLACGTNHQGLSAIQHGDTVEVEISQIGRFAVGVQDPLRRRWARGIDQEIAERVRTGQITAPAAQGARA